MIDYEKKFDTNKNVVTIMKKNQTRNNIKK